MTKKQSQVKVARKNVSKPKSPGPKWVLAVDLFSDLDFSKVARFATQFASQVGAEVEGAYVLAPESLNWTGEFSGPWIKRYKPLTEAKAREVEPRIGVPIQVVPCKESSVRASVKALIRHARKQKANCIVISTHARRGLERLTLGSYAETLILMSPIPVLVINPSQELPRRVNRILIPTDLSRKSERFVLSMAPLAKAANAFVDVLYKVPDPIDPLIQQGVYAVGGGWVSVQSYIEMETKERQEQQERLCAQLHRKGVRANCQVESSPLSLVETINNAAKNNGADLIAVLTQSGPVGAVILGSVARGLVRSAPVPVMICR